MTEYHHFIHRGPGQRAGRTYSVWMQPDLFGQWTVVRVHGGRSRAGRTVVTPVESRAVGERLVRRICQVRERHGYEKDDQISARNVCHASA